LPNIDTLFSVWVLEQIAEREFVGGGERGVPKTNVFGTPRKAGCLFPKKEEEGSMATTMADTNLNQQLQNLFREVGQAHHQAYIETDGADPEWPIWYAGFLQERLGPLINASFTKSELVYLLILVTNEQPLRAPGADWPNYYAKFFIERYR